MTGRTLRVWINHQDVGSLREVTGLWSFQYTEEWLKNPRGFALSPHLPFSPTPLLDGATSRPVQWYFDNLLPEEGQRLMLAADAGLGAADAFGLLAWYGAESAGSLTLSPSHAVLPVAEPARSLSDEVLDARIRQLPRVSLMRGATKRLSLAGAQHKLAVVFDGGALFEPVGSSPSTHILKPDHPDEDYPHSVVNEWFTMQLARRMGLEVPGVHRRYVPSPVYLIDRFDRFTDGQGWQRRHVIDACQVLGLDRSFKYSQGSLESLAALANACRSPAVARTRLFSWLVFNVLVGNSDAHLKNLSFLVSHEGIQLAPFYDLLSVATYDSVAFDNTGWPGLTQLAWPILGARQFAAVNRPLLLEAAGALHIAKATAERLLDYQCRRIVQEAEHLCTQINAENTQIVASRPELSATFAGESRALRAVVYTVIKVMAMQLNAG